ncbi:MAG: endonuclease, partial [Muribaculaceae bacterium]|nr:endonuclease [Muribaculaceae bacterium]
MKHLFAIICLSILLTASAQSQADSPFVGMSGREIIETIRADWRPAKTVTSSSDISGVMAEYARLSEGSYRDYFSLQAASSISQLKAIALVPLAWWDEYAADFSIVKADLHNIVPANAISSPKRSDYPPGEVTDATYDNGYWKSGIGTINGIETNFYEPADDLKGDFARIYMYMVAAYPQPLWFGRGTMLFADGYYPLLTTYGRSVLLAWHRADPVDEAEKLRNDVIARSQGNPNPFVSFPEIAEYIWGKHSDETFPGTPDNPDKPDIPDNPDDPQPEPIMLTAVYSVTKDGHIDFRSPYVAAGSQWTFDGKKGDSPSIVLTDKSVGR